MLAINGRTLDKWRRYLLLKLEDQRRDRLKLAVEAYFGVAIVEPQFSADAPRFPSARRSGRS